MTQKAAHKQWGLQGRHPAGRKARASSTVGGGPWREGDLVHPRATCHPKNPERQSGPRAAETRDSQEKVCPLTAARGGQGLQRLHLDWRGNRVRWKLRPARKEVWCDPAMLRSTAVLPCPHPPPFASWPNPDCTPQPIHQGKAKGTPSNPTRPPGLASGERADCRAGGAWRPPRPVGVRLGNPGQTLICTGPQSPSRWSSETQTARRTKNLA